MHYMQCFFLSVLINSEEVMERLVKQKFKRETNGSTSEVGQEVYYEGQNVNDLVEKEEQEEVIKGKKKKNFIANYNMFF